MFALYRPHQNRLLAAFPSVEAGWLWPHLELTPMPLGTVLCESGGEWAYAYFPITSIVSLLYLAEDGASIEVALVGNEGMLGLALLTGGKTSLNRAIVQCGGIGFRIRAELLKRAFDRAGPLQHLLLRYLQALMTHMAQMAACNRRHSIDQQLCRWLLMALDRLPCNELGVTQESISNMLGVRREGVTEAAGKLRRAGLIQYKRGHVVVLNRAGLEARSCECYAVVAREYDRLLCDSKTSRLSR